jgi:hypothetical protein
MWCHPQAPEALAQPFSSAPRKERELRAALSRDRISVASHEWVLARYNDPSTRPMFRRNEVLLPVADFDLWAD